MTYYKIIETLEKRTLLHLTPWLHIIWWQCPG